MLTWRMLQTTDAYLQMLQKSNKVLTLEWPITAASHVKNVESRLAVHACSKSSAIAERTMENVTRRISGPQIGFSPPPPPPAGQMSPPATAPALAPATFAFPQRNRRCCRSLLSALERAACRTHRRKNSNQPSAAIAAALAWACADGLPAAAGPAGFMSSVGADFWLPPSANAALSEARVVRALTS